MSEWMRNNKTLLKCRDYYEQQCRKKFADQHFLLIFIATTMQETIYFYRHHPFSPKRKNSLSQHFFEKLIRYYQEEHNLMSSWATMQDTIYFLSPPPKWMRTPKIRLLSNNAGHHLPFIATTHFVLPSKKISLIQHFFEKLIRYN